MVLEDLNPKGHSLTPEIEANLEDLLYKLNSIQPKCPTPFIVTSGYRTPEEQAIIDPKHPGSAHCFGCAVDLADEQERLWIWVQSQLDLMKQYSLYIENPNYAPGHLHLQTIPPKSGHIIFIP